VTKRKPVIATEPTKSGAKFRETVRKMLGTPPKPHNEMKVGRRAQARHPFFWTEELRKVTLARSFLSSSDQFLVLGASPASI
jgi:hypothetical protein